MWDVKYRPMRFTDVLGQDGSVQVLKARLRHKTGLDTSYIFSGGHGQGKTTLARILARALLCQNLGEDAEPCNECDNCRDILNESSAAFVEMDSASKGTIDVARSIVEDLPFVIPGAAKRIYVFDESHRMSRDAQDVLLKPIEDKKLVAVFCTTEPEKIRGPIRSRCEVYPIRKITREDILQRMKWVLTQEGVPHEDDAVMTVIDYSHGHVRDVLNRLEMIAQLGSVTAAGVREYLKLSVVSTYYEILLALGSPAAAVALVEQVCEQVDVEDVASGLAEAAMNSFRLANGMHADFSLVDRDLAKKVYDQYGPSVIGLADYFLQGYRPTRIGLVCSVVRCASGVPTKVAAGTAPPVLVQAPAYQSPATTTTSPDVPSPTAQPAPVVAPVAVAPPPPLPTPAPTTGYVLPSGKALTELDHKAIAQNLPRGSRPVQKPQAFKGAPVPDYLTPEEWKQEFEAMHLSHERV